MEQVSLFARYLILVYQKFKFARNIQKNYMWWQIRNRNGQQCQGHSRPNIKNKAKFKFKLPKLNSSAEIYYKFHVTPLIGVYGMIIGHVKYLHRRIHILGYYVLHQASVSVSLQAKSQAQALQQSNKKLQYTSDFQVKKLRMIIQSSLL